MLAIDRGEIRPEIGSLITSVERGDAGAAAALFTALYAVQEVQNESLGVRIRITRGVDIAVERWL